MDALRDLYVEMVVDAAEFADRLARRDARPPPVHVAADARDRPRGHVPRPTRSPPCAAAAGGSSPWTRPIATRSPAIAPDTRYLGGGRLAAIANAAGRPPRELVPPLNEEATILRLFNERVLGQAAAQ